jgi:GT2 family glycosyltransferase
VSAPPVDVIIPVYNQLELVLQCITSLRRAECAVDHRIVVINDCSPDQTVGAALAGLAAEGAIELHTNAQNLGFTKTVNFGMQLHPDRDVVLLNSDTIVYPQWLDRLQAAALCDPRIATANPITTQRGSHISCYPGLADRYDDQLEVDDSELDRIAREVNAGCYTQVHTTVGFCMYIRRAALDDIGFFDAIHFPVAYGEESDFCYRARKAGWRHVIAGDVFVTHLEGKSFSDRKAQLMADMLKRFVVLHPECPELDRKFAQQDPLLTLRRAIDCGRLQRQMESQGALAVASETDETPRGGRLWMKFDEAAGTVAFKAPAIPAGSLPNVGTFALPADLVRLNAALQLVGVDRLVCASDRTRDALARAVATCHPSEVSLQAEVVRDSPAGRRMPTLATLH